jgi:hypothetical protein
LPPSSGFKNKQKAELATCFMLVSYLVYFSALEMEATRLTETSVDFRRTTWTYIPEDKILLILRDFAL